MDLLRPHTSYSNNIVSSMKMNVAKLPDQPAIIAGGRTVTWKEMWKRTAQLANGLYGLGITRGDRVALFLPNGFEFSEAFVATTRGGFVVTPVNFNFKAEELAYQLNDCTVSAVITCPALYPLVEQAAARAPSIKAVIVSGNNLPQGAHGYEELIRKSSSAEPEVTILPEDIHMILYTSGTTGRPKGAIRGYAEDYHTGMTVCVEWKIRSCEIQLVVTPQYHAGPCAWYLATLVSGGTLVVLDRFDPQALLAAIETYQANWTMMVPVMFDRLLSLPEDQFSQFDLTSLRVLISGGAPLHTGTKLKIKNVFPGVELNEFYGSTELGVSTTLRDADQLRKTRCVGKPLQDQELVLLDEMGNRVPTGEVGLLYSTGLGGFRGYWGNPEATNEAFLDGEWATVGDLARQDDEGYYYIVDRAKDMIITGGVNVYPAEIEDVIRSLPQVLDVAVIGVPDADWGEAVKAVVVAVPESGLDEAGLIEFCKERMAKFKVPKSVDFTDQLPRNQSGKLLKKDLKAPYWKHANIKVS